MKPYIRTGYTHYFISNFDGIGDQPMLDIDPYGRLVVLHPYITTPGGHTTYNIEQMALERQARFVAAVMWTNLVDCIDLGYDQRIVEAEKSYREFQQWVEVYDLYSE